MSLYIGVMSGTSLDGVDVAIVHINNHSHCQLINANTFSFEPSLRNKLAQLISDPQCCLSTLGRLNIELGLFIAGCINSLLLANTISATEINAIGSHGQTIFHDPDSELPFSMQIGDPNIIAQQTGITTIADFRQRDMSVGGQGAPLVPAFHHAQFKSDSHDTVVINIGGISNLTLLPADDTHPVIGFDTGPGNALMDSWIFKHHNMHYDKNGEWAKLGNVHAELLTSLLDEDYFMKNIPKSTGRELFNLRWLEKYIEQLPSNIEAEDVQATLLMLTATSIANAVTTHCPQATSLFICGGGAQNIALMDTLSLLLPNNTISTTQKLGLHPDWVEACAFAWLAYKNIHRQPVNLMSVTGAAHPVILGATYWSNEDS
jgi:anhydro-N-acetylmuramic acid kinase